MLGLTRAHRVQIRLCFDFEYIPEELPKSRHVGKFGRTGRKLTSADDRDDKDDIFEDGIISYISYLSYLGWLFVEDVNDADVVLLAGLKVNAVFFQL